MICGGAQVVRVPRLDYPVEVAQVPRQDAPMSVDVGQRESVYVHPIVRGYYLDTGHERWQDLADDSRSSPRVVSVILRAVKDQCDGRTLVVHYRDECKQQHAPTSIGRKPFLERFMPIPGTDPMPGIPVEALAAIRADDPEAWESAAVPAAISRALDEPTYEGLDKLTEEDTGLTEEEHAELDEGVAELEPERIPLGPLGADELPEDCAMLRKIIRITGWCPVVTRDLVSGSVQVCYRVIPQQGDAEWDEHTHVQTEGRAVERLTLALRIVLRNVNLNHKKDL